MNISNQNVLAAEAQYRAARAEVQIARSALFPTLTAGPTVGGSKARAGSRLIRWRPPTAFTPIIKSRSMSPTKWICGAAIRRNMRANAETAQATEAQLENAKLTYQADLAQDYFQLHGTDGDVALLQSTVDSYTGFLKLTQARHDSGIASGADVAQAQTQLDSAKEQLIDLGVARAQYRARHRDSDRQAASRVVNPSRKPIKDRAAAGAGCDAIHAARAAAGYRDVGAPDGFFERADRNRGSRLLSFADDQWGRGPGQFQLRESV